MHALIATAARAEVSEPEASAIEEAYLSIGAVITTLDSLVDDTEDKRAGKLGYIRVYEGRGEIEGRLIATVEQALARAEGLRDGAHHAMTLAGVGAYYTTHPGARDPQNRAIRARVRGALAPAIWPALLVLESWRAVKRARGKVSAEPGRAGQDRAPGSGEQSVAEA